MVDELRNQLREQPDSQNDILSELREESLRNVIERENDAVDPFFVPEDLKPAGWTVEWKATHVMGQELDAAYQAALQQDGWVPAPAKMFKKMMPSSFKGKTIQRGGQLLMMRPKELTDKKRAKEQAAARGQVNAKLKSLGMTKEGELDRKVQVVKKSYEAMEIPD